MARISNQTNGLRELKGQHRYIKNIPDTKPIAHLWKLPVNLPKEAMRFYRHNGRILVKANVLTELDKDNFIRLCLVHDRLCTLERTLQTQGESIITEKGDIKRHPAATSYKELFPQYMRLSEKFGLTPYDRRRIDLPIDTNPDDKDREFLKL